MKTTIIISLLIICSVCKGQDSLTMKVEKDSFGIYQGSTLLNKWATSAFGIAYMPYNSTAYDTVKVEMIVTNSDPLKNQVVKIIGYEVVQTGQHIYDPIYPQYLDIVKQPLSKDLTIWLAKEIK